MPELPDLQVFSRYLNHRLGGKTLEKIDMKRGLKANVSAAKLKKALQGQNFSGFIAKERNFGLLLRTRVPSAFILCCVEDYSGLKKKILINIHWLNFFLPGIRDLH